MAVLEAPSRGRRCSTKNKETSFEVIVLNRINTHIIIAVIVFWEGNPFREIGKDSTLNAANQNDIER